MIYIVIWFCAGFAMGISAGMLMTTSYVQRQNSYKMRTYKRFYGSAAPDSDALIDQNDD